MWNFKRLLGLLSLYGVILGIYGLFQEKVLVSVHFFHHNTVFMVMVLGMYYDVANSLGSAFLEIYRFEKMKIYYHRKYLAYTLSNLVIVGGSFVIHMGLQVARNGWQMTGGPFANFSYPLFLYPIHLFLAMEIVGLFIVSGALRGAYHRWTLGWFLFAVGMYMVSKGAGPRAFVPMFLFQPYFAGAFHRFTVMTYAGWLVLFLVYCWRKDKAVEM